MKQKTLMHSSVIAAIVIAAVIGVSIVTGFPGSGPAATAGPASDTNTSVTPVITGNSVAGTADYIRIDAIADKTTGDLLVVTGSTNIPAGTILMIQAGNYGGSATVHEGTGGVNRFSAPVDTFGLKPGSVTITVTRMEGSVTTGEYQLGTTSGKATFTLKGTFLGTEEAVQPAITGDDYILINAIGDRKVGEQFLITGTTSLPVGTNIIWQVIPESGTPKTSIDMTAENGIMANNGVTKGEGTSNRVSLAVDMDGFPAGNYIVLVSEMKGDMQAGNITTGDLTGSALFTMK
jgi:hypothetical protein